MGSSSSCMIEGALSWTTCKKKVLGMTIIVDLLSLSRSERISERVSMLVLSAIDELSLGASLST